MDESSQLIELRAENARLIQLHEVHGIAWQKLADPVLVQRPAKESEHLIIQAALLYLLQRFRQCTIASFDGRGLVFHHDFIYQHVKMGTFVLWQFMA